MTLATPPKHLSLLTNVPRAEVSPSRGLLAIAKAKAYNAVAIVPIATVMPKARPEVTVFPLEMALWVVAVGMMIAAAMLPTVFGVGFVAMMSVVITRIPVVVSRVVAILLKLARLHDSRCGRTGNNENCCANCWD